MERKKNYFAGPCVLPVEVLEEVQRNIVDYQNNGLSMIEASHRGGMFEKMYDDCIALVKELYSIPEDYDVYFLGGGATLQFTMIPYNFLRKNTTADYAMTGVWANKATEDAIKLGRVNVIFDGKDSKYSTLPEPGSLRFSDDSAYVYICANETIGGLEWKEYPETGDIPLICDMSSNFFSQPVPVEKFSMIYGGVQKNLGPAGATLIIMKKSMLDKRNGNIPAYLDYGRHSKDKGLYNTPPVFSIWVVKLVLEWIKSNGGVQGMYDRSLITSGMIYDAIDNSDGFYYSPVDSRFRSRMNVCFRIRNQELEGKFLEEAKNNGMLGLKGHRSVGGLRASLYNSLPTADVEFLRDFMDKFRKENS